MLRNEFKNINKWTDLPEMGLETSENFKKIGRDIK